MGFLDRFRKPQGPPPGTQAPPAAQSLPPPPPPGRVLPNEPLTVPLGSVVQVVGESYYQDAFQRLLGGPRGEGFHDRCTAQLVPEPTNEYDPAAVAVHIGGLKVGHLSREDARSYRYLVDRAIASHGRAMAAALIKGGWNRGGGDAGSFGVELYISESVPPPPPSDGTPKPQALGGRRVAAGTDEMRLRTQSGSPVTVTGEEKHQDVLTALPPSDDGYVAELVLVDDRIEVRIAGQRVGALTPKMTDRFRRLVQRANAAGKRLTCMAMVDNMGERGL